MSIIIYGITKEEFAKRMMGEGITIIDPDILGSFESFYGYRTEELPPHGRLIDADALIRKAPDIVAYDEDGEESNFGYTEDMILEAPTIIGAEEAKE